MTFNGVGQTRRSIVCPSLHLCTNRHRNDLFEPVILISETYPYPKLDRTMSSTSVGLGKEVGAIRLVEGRTLG
ncbi:hypothetical protein V6N13_113324 [Hibiscus sabdariffa]